MFIAVLFLTLSTIAFADDSNEVDYNKYVKWEKRTLLCDNAGYCRLAVGNDGPVFDTDCFNEMFKPMSFVRRPKQPEEEMAERTVCDISCRGADRDSVISKTPSNNHNCVRFHTYNSLHRGNDWYIWRSGHCRNTSITLEIHCGFPYLDKKSN
ncbi:hypothetical protein QR680_003029 [Steinernema hermaphroditum]|uniref:DUF7808 domain-containing protein n=1 Tax=Steinernema hermaphroditum TaxID=289476 RepID=A0AA39H591_9BILA|nr:hypothetical protein QR680_003029 [Steinernema hermaphroditum]